MKQAVIQFFRLLISAVTVLFCLSVLFGKIGGIDIKSMGKRLAEQAESRSVFSENGARLLWLMELPAPQTEVDPVVCLVGETYHLWSYLRVRQSAEEEWKYVSETEDVTVELMEITDEAGATTEGTAGGTAGETAGGTAGETAGEAAGETAGEAAGETAGETAGGTAGETAGETVGGDWEKGELYFSQSGRYVVKVRVTGSYGRTVIQRILIPVAEV